jgi:hypothetical protein
MLGNQCFGMQPKSQLGLGLLPTCRQAGSPATANLIRQPRVCIAISHDTSNKGSKYKVLNI